MSLLSADQIKSASERYVDKKIRAPLYYSETLHKDIEQVAKMLRTSANAYKEEALIERVLEDRKRLGLMD